MRKQVLLRRYASQWAAVNKWRDLNQLFYYHKHRIIPIEKGNMSLCNGTSMKEALLTIQEFLHLFLLPSCQYDQKEDDTIHIQVAYLAQHNLLEQIPELKKSAYKKGIILKRFQ